MKKKRMVPLVYVVGLFVLIGLTAISLGRDERPKVVVVLDDLNSEYWKIIGSGAKKAFHDFNVDGKILVPDSINPTKAKLLKSVLRKNPDAVIVVPIDPIIPVFKEYKKKNIPVLFVDQEVDWKDQTTYIGRDNFILGKKAGELLASELEPGDRVALIGGSKNLAGDDRLKGAKEAFEAVGIEIATEQAGFEENGNLRAVMGDILRTNPDIKGVYATTDLTALYALKVIEEKGLKIPVVGADGIIDMVKAIETGKLSATVSQNPYDMGYLSVESALKVIRGGEVDKRIDTGVDIITSDNAKEKLDFLTEALD